MNVVHACLRALATGIVAAFVAASALAADPLLVLLATPGGPTAGPTAGVPVPAGPAVARLREVGCLADDPYPLQNEREQPVPTAPLNDGARVFRRPNWYSSRRCRPT